MTTQTRELVDPNVPPVTPLALRTFRPDIEGLRAVAVGLVVAYHAGVPGFGGGYVGVDVFYVISGFLITGLLVREHAASGTIAFGAFYARRARRLLPAAALVLSVTAIASWLILPPLLMPGVATDVAGAAGYAANVRFAMQATDYLASEAASPVLHYWSLAVEEQFYLVWPVVMLVLLRARRMTAAGVAAIGAVSFAACVWLTGVSQPWAFFSLPTRAWQLAAGGLLALVSHRLARAPMRAAASWSGIGAIVLAALLFDATTLYPGTAAVLPVAGALLVLAAGAGARAPGSAETLLGLRPFAVVGRLSYSLYLWHWPLLVLGAVWAGRALTPGERALAVAAAMAASALTYRLVENPVRYARGLQRPRAAFVMTGVLSVSLIGGSLAVGAAATGRLEPDVGAPPVDPGDPARARALPAALMPSLADVRDDAPASYADGCHLSFTEVIPEECVYGDRVGERTIALVGDSHAAQWLPAFDLLGRQRGWRVISLTKSACPAVFVTPYLTRYARDYVECDRWHEAVEERLNAERPDLVVAASNAATLPGARVGTDAFAAAWRRGTVEMLTAFSRAAGSVVILGDTPRPADDVPVCLSANRADMTPCTFRTRAPAIVAIERAAAQARSVPFIDTTSWVCPERRCIPVDGNLLLYRDHHHLTTVFVERLAPRLARALDEAGVLK